MSAPLNGFSVLVVEDDASKRDRIVAILSAVCAETDTSIECVGSLSAARRCLVRNVYNLMVLDIALPQVEGGEVVRDGGMQLLREMNERDLYRMPGAVVGLTAYEDILELGRGIFDAQLRHLLKYDQVSDSWLEPFERGVRDLVDAQTARRMESAAYGCELAIVCALAKPELDAVLEVEWDWRLRIIHGEATTFHQGAFTAGQVTRTAYAAAAPRMGMPAAAVTASKMIHYFRPRLLVMTGIAAGWKDAAALGDLLVADPSWDCGSGKWLHDADGQLRFLQEPHQLDLDPFVREPIRRLQSDYRALGDIRHSYKGERPDGELRLLIGPVASNASVIADGVTLERIVEDQNRKTLGLEMETYGVFVAAAESPRPRPAVMSIKTVVDYADGLKKARFQAYGAAVSARAMQALVERFVDWEGLVT